MDRARRKETEMITRILRAKEVLGILGIPKISTISKTLKDLILIL